VPVLVELRRQEFNRIRRLADLLEISQDAVMAECLRAGMKAIERNAAEDIEGPPPSGWRLKRT
jgi:hypothetical protein